MADLAQDLVDAAAIGLDAMEHELESLIESHCKLNADLTPRRETLEAIAWPAVEALEKKIAKVRSAIAAAEAARG